MFESKKQPTPEELQAAAVAKGVDWTIRGYGAGAMVIAKCKGCHSIFEIEARQVIPTVHIRHCVTRTQIPEWVYEAWWVAREGKPREGSNSAVRWLR